MSERHIGFTGTRKGLTRPQHTSLRVITDFLSGHNDVVTHSGDCVGADHMFWKLVKDHAHTVGHIPTIDTYRSFDAYDEELTPLPYIARNRAIVEASEVIVACPGEMVEETRSGTWSTIRYARRQRKGIAIIFPDGTVSKYLEVVRA